MLIDAMVSFIKTKVETPQKRRMTNSLATRNLHKKAQIISFECDDFGCDYSVDNDPMDLPSAWPPGACRRR